MGDQYYEPECFVAPCHDPVQWFLACCFNPCLIYADRVRVLRHVEDGTFPGNYKCCQDRCECFDPICLGPAQKFPLCCLALEACICSGSATLGTREVLSKHKGLKDRGFENPLNICLTIFEIVGIAKLMAPYTACLHVQFRHELQSYLDNPVKTNRTDLKDALPH